MRLICFWCFLVAAVRSQNDDFYAPQTYRQVAPVLFQPMNVPWNLKNNHLDQRSLFSPARNDVIPQSTTVDPWRPAPVNENWREPGPTHPKSEPWRQQYAQLTKEQQAAIIHHKQSLSSEGSFRYEYASDNGLAAGEVIEPDGSRVGGYQYKDPSGQTVKIKYRAGKDGFQILEGSHLPKSPEPVAPSGATNYHQQAYQQQQQQYQLQQQYNQQRPEPQPWRQTQVGTTPATSNQQQYQLQQQQYQLQQQYNQQRPEPQPWRQTQVGTTPATSNQQQYQLQQQQYQLQQQYNQQRPEPQPWRQTQVGTTPATSNQQQYQLQQQQYQLQQQYNQQRPEPQPWRQTQGADDGQRAAGAQPYAQSWRAPAGPEDDGQYRENELENNKAHNFGEGYAFSFKG